MPPSAAAHLVVLLALVVRRLLHVQHGRGGNLVGREAALRQGLACRQGCKSGHTNTVGAVHGCLFRGDNQGAAGGDLGMTYKQTPQPGAWEAWLCILRFNASACTCTQGILATTSSRRSSCTAMSSGQLPSARRLTLEGRRLAEQVGVVSQELVGAAQLVNVVLAHLLHQHHQVVHGVAVVLVAAYGEQARRGGWVRRASTGGTQRTPAARLRQCC